MTCRELIDFILDYREGSLAPELCQAFEAHLAVCSACVDYLASYDRTIELAKAACAGPDAPPPESVPDELVAAILATRRSDER